MYIYMYIYMYLYETELLDLLVSNYTSTYKL